MTNVLVEGGGKTLGSFFDAGLGDEAVVFVAPKLIGGTGAPSPLNAVGPKMMSDLQTIDSWSVSRSGDDQVYELRMK